MVNHATAPDDDTPDMFPDLVAPAPPDERLKALKRPLSHLAPGVWASELPEFETPTHVVCRLQPVGDGKYELVPEDFPGYLRMTEDFGKKVGLDSVHHITFRRLMALGYIRHVRIAPHTILVEIDSLKEHLRSTANDTARDVSFWTPERVAEWRTLNGSTANELAVGKTK